MKLLDMAILGGAALLFLSKRANASSLTPAIGEVPPQVIPNASPVPTPTAPTNPVEAAVADLTGTGFNINIPAYFTTYDSAQMFLQNQLDLQKYAVYGSSGLYFIGDIKRF